MTQIITYAQRVLSFHCDLPIYKFISSCSLVSYYCLCTRMPDSLHLYKYTNVTGLNLVNIDVSLFFLCLRYERSWSTSRNIPSPPSLSSRTTDRTISAGITWALGPLPNFLTTMTRHPMPTCRPPCKLSPPPGPGRRLAASLPPRRLLLRQPSRLPHGVPQCHPGGSPFG